MENISSSSSTTSSYIQHFPFTPSPLDDMLGQAVAVGARIWPERMDQGPEGNNIGLFDIQSWSSSLDSNSPACSVTADRQSSFGAYGVSNTNTSSLCDTGGEVGSCFGGPGMVSSSTEALSPDPAAAAAVDKGLELVNLLLACAEAVACRDTSVAAATLHQIWLLADPKGDPLQRVSFCFAAGLRSRLSLLQNVGSSGSRSVTAVAGDHSAGAMVSSREERMEAFHYLHQATPYAAFGFMAANEAIYQAAKGKDRLHIVDLGMSHALQWPSLIQTLASRPGGSPSVRITGVLTGHDTSLLELESTMGLLTNQARRIGVTVEFRMLHEASSSSTLLLTADALQLRRGEAVFVNSVMHLHKYVKESRGSLKAVLAAIKKLRPALVTVVEQDANHNGPFFLGRFLESLHYYSALFDSLEASLPRASAQRTRIEGGYFMGEIANIVACEGGERVERHERADQWRRKLGRAGFQGVGLRSISQIRRTVSSSSSSGCDGYTVGSEKGCLLLGWKGRPVMWASAWQLNHAAASSSSSSS